jgi:hypothetical protein
MDKNIKSLEKMTKTINQIPLKSKHVLWNYGPSEDNFDSDQIPFTRLYCAAIDNRSAYRKNTKSKIFDMLSKENSGVVQIGSDVEFKVKESEWGLLYFIFDARASLESLNFKENGIVAKRDYDLKKKDVLTIVDYLERIYK